MRYAVDTNIYTHSTMFAHGYHLSKQVSMRVCAHVGVCSCMRMRVSCCLFLVGGNLEHRAYDQGETIPPR